MAIDNNAMTEWFERICSDSIRWKILIFTWVKLKKNAACGTSKYNAFPLTIYHRPPKYIYWWVLEWNKYLSRELHDWVLLNDTLYTANRSTFKELATTYVHEWRILNSEKKAYSRSPFCVRLLWGDANRLNRLDFNNFLAVRTFA